MNPRSVSETAIGDFLTAVASAEETHGAVSTAAVAGGLGCSLLLMVATLPKTKSDSIDDRTRLIEAAAALRMCKSS
jgi:formiminotetrahydrofolate cyclodeaminase